MDQSKKIALTFKLCVWVCLIGVSFEQQAGPSCCSSCFQCLWFVRWYRNHCQVDTKKNDDTSSLVIELIDVDAGLKHPVIDELHAQIKGDVPRSGTPISIYRKEQNLKCFQLNNHIVHDQLDDRVRAALNVSGRPNPVDDYVAVKSDGSISPKSKPSPASTQAPDPLLDEVLFSAHSLKQQTTPSGSPRPAHIDDLGSSSTSKSSLKTHSQSRSSSTSSSLVELPEWVLIDIAEGD